MWRVNKKSDFMELLKSWRLIFFLLFLLASFVIIGAKGIDFGIDFKGGSLFQIEFDEPVKSLEEKVKITNTVQQRVDWTGLKDTTVNFFGERFVIVQVAETRQETIERIESLLRRQGRFEVLLEGKRIFTGEDIIEISKNPQQGYGFQRQEGGVNWFLPFVLKSGAAENFKAQTFHKCTLVSFDPGTGKQYDCERTYFFIDRSNNAVIVLPRELFESDKQKFLAGNPIDGQPSDIEIDEVLLNSGAELFIVEATGLKPEQDNKLLEVVKQKKQTIVPPDLDNELRQKLVSLGFELSEVPFPSNEQQPWLWNATGLRQVISLSEDVANMDVAKLEDASPLSTLLIRGSASDLKTAQQRLSDLEVLLESGSLSVSVKSISKESISPLLGEKFLTVTGIAGIIALLVVTLIVFLRYRVVKLVIPIMFISISEVIITIALSSLISKFDLGAVAGLLAAVGTGVNDQIVISDELTKGVREAEVSLSSRIKRAFFIVVAAAATVIAVMTPIILIGFGLGKLVGFAITTITGVLVGVLITRPAFGEIARAVMEK